MRSSILHRRPREKAAAITLIVNKPPGIKNSVGGVTPADREEGEAEGAQWHLYPVFIAAAGYSRRSRRSSSNGRFALVRI